MIRKLLGAAAASALGIALTITGGAGRVSAMVNGTLDTTHPMVGSFWVQYPGTTQYFGICTGTFVAPTVFVTASHCANYPVSIGANSFISLSQKTSGVLPADAIPATVHLNPAYHTANGTDLYNHDVSVLTVDPSRAYTGPLAQLPTAGLLDDLKKSRALSTATFTVVGYGTSSMVVVPKIGPTFPGTAGRTAGTLGFHSLDKAVLHEDQRSKAGFDGACYGDSGGPSFLDPSNVIVGVTSTGDIPCYATNTAYRLDTDEARAFLGGYVKLP